jgi:tetratricopeptide (TPR) repeat protein
MADLRQTLLLDELKELQRRRWSGVVALASGDVRKGIYLRRGGFVFAASTVEEDKLGEHLVRTGRITREQFEGAIRESQGPGRRLGQALVETGAVAEGDLDALVAEQVRSIALSAFRWTSGEVRYQQVDEPIPSDLALALSTDRLLLEGTRIFPDAARLEASLGDPGRRVRRAAQFPFEYASIPGSAAEKLVLEKAGAGSRIVELLGLSLPRPQLVRAVFALLAGGLLEEEQDAAAARPPLAPEHVVRPLSSAPPPSPLPSPPAARRAPSPPPVSPPKAAPPPAPPVPIPPVAAPPSPPRMAAAPTMPSRPAPEPFLPSDETPPSGVFVRRATPPPDPALVPTPAWGVPAAAAPQTPEQVVRLARDCLDKGDRPRAISLLREEVDRNPQAYGCRRLLAMTLASDAVFSQELETMFLKTLEENPKDNELRYRLATWYKKLGLGTRALLQLKKVLDVDPEHAAAWRDLGELEAAEGGPRRPRLR